MEAIIGVIGVVVAASVWVLPETKGRPLPLDLAEMQTLRLGKDRKEEEE